MTRTEAKSARITALEEELRAGDRKALDAFWARLETEGTPIVESIEVDADFRLLTFVWRDGRDDTREIGVEGGPASGPREEHRLTRLEGTDLWFKTYRVRADLRGHYAFARNDPPQATGPDADASEDSRPPRLADPMNPARLTWPAYDLDAKDHGGECSVVALPDAHAQPWAAVRPGVPAGSVEQRTLRSEVLGNERRVWVYRPATDAPATGWPVMVLLDGWEWSVPLPIAPTIDNLIHDGAIPPVVVVMPESLGEIRGVELPCHESFPTFLAEELVPWVREGWRVTSDPARTIVAGQSYGGLASAFSGLRRPDVFGNVLSQSGSFWWKAETEFDEGSEWLTRQYAESPRVPVRFWLEVGLLEGKDMLSSNRHMRNVLEAKGYDVTYVEFNHDHWWPSWLGSLPDALQAITGGWGDGSPMSGRG